MHPERIVGQPEVGRGGRGGGSTSECAVAPQNFGLPLRIRRKAQAKRQELLPTTPYLGSLHASGSSTVSTIRPSGGESVNTPLLGVYPGDCYAPASFPVRAAAETCPLLLAPLGLESSDTHDSLEPL